MPLLVAFAVAALAVSGRLTAPSSPQPASAPVTTPPPAARPSEREVTGLYPLHRRWSASLTFTVTDAQGRPLELRAIDPSGAVRTLWRRSPAGGAPDPAPVPAVWSRSGALAFARPAATGGLEVAVWRDSRVEPAGRARRVCCLSWWDPPQPGAAGERLAYLAADDADGRGWSLVVTAGGGPARALGPVRPLTGGAGWAPVAWMSSGDALVTAERGEGATPRPVLRLTTLAGRSRVVLEAAQAAAIAGLGRAGPFALSGVTACPGGSYLAVAVEAGTGAARQLAVVWFDPLGRLAPQALRPFLGDAFESPPVCGPREHRVALAVRERAGPGTLVQYLLVTPGERRTTATPGFPGRSAAAPVWSPDGDLVAIQPPSRDDDLLVVLDGAGAWQGRVAPTRLGQPVRLVGWAPGPAGERIGSPVPRTTRG